MKYYSEELKKFFNSEDECKQAEAAANAGKESYQAEIADLEKQLEEAAAAVDKKRKEAEAKKAELDKLLKERADIAKKIMDKRLEYMSKDPLKRAYKIKKSDPRAVLFGDFGTLFDEIFDEIFDRRFEHRDK